MKPPAWLPALLGFLIAVGPAATDMYLPAFPAVEASFHSAPGIGADSPSPPGSPASRSGRSPRAASPTASAGACRCCSAPPASRSPASAARWRPLDRLARRLPRNRRLRRLGQHGDPARHGARPGRRPRRRAIMMSKLMLVMGVAPILAPSIGGAGPAVRPLALHLRHPGDLRRDRLHPGLALSARNAATAAPRQARPRPTSSAATPASCASAGS